MAGDWCSAVISRSCSSKRSSSFGFWGESYVGILKLAQKNGSQEEDYVQGICVDGVESLAWGIFITLPLPCVLSMGLVYSCWLKAWLRLYFTKHSSCHQVRNALLFWALLRGEDVLVKCISSVVTSLLMTCDGVTKQLNSKNNDIESYICSLSLS